MDQAPDSAPVVHDARALRFRMELPGGTAELAYVPVSDGVLDFYSTWVPPDERGRRVATRLVTAALAHARARGLRVVPSCWYVRRWIDAHPEQADLLA
jgi:predicted GNAT family acetyltransferase